MSDAQAPARSLAEIGRDAARTAQRAALLGALEACGWNMSETARQLRMGNASGVIRSLRTLGLLSEYADAKARGDVRRGGHRGGNESALRETDARSTVAA